MNAGIGETRASSASSGLTPINRATMVTKVTSVWTSPNAVEIIITGRFIESVWARRSRSYDLLRRAQTDSINRPVMMISTAFGLVQTLVTFVTMVALLIGVSPLLALLALVSPIPAFIADTRYGWRGYNIARWGSRLLRRMNYLVSLVTTDSYAKEVKLFGLGGYFIDRYRLIAQRYYGSQRRQVVRRYLTGFLWGNLSTIATSVTYLYVALQAIVGKLTLGDLTLYTTAAQSVQNSIQGILGGFSGMYEHN